MALNGGELGGGGVALGTRREEAGAPSGEAVRPLQQLIRLRGARPTPRCMRAAVRLNHALALDALETRHHRLHAVREALELLRALRLAAAEGVDGGGGRRRAACRGRAATDASTWQLLVRITSSKSSKSSKSCCAAVLPSHRHRPRLDRLLGRLARASPRHMGALSFGHPGRRLDPPAVSKDAIAAKLLEHLHTHEDCTRT